MAAFIRDGDTGGLGELFSPGANLEVVRLYRNGYYRSVREVLSSSFPVVSLCLGAERFAYLAKCYGQAQPPKRGTLTNYGENFALWLADQLGPEQAWVADIARLDWAWLQCLHGADSIPVTAAELLDTREPEHVQVQRLSNSRLLQLARPLLGFWMELKLGHEPRATTVPDTLDSADQWIIFWRPEMTVFSRELTAMEAQLLEALSPDKDADTDEASADEMATLFGQWLNAGLLQKYTGEQLE